MHTSNFTRPRGEAKSPSSADGEIIEPGLTPGSDDAEIWFGTKDEGVYLDDFHGWRNIYRLVTEVARPAGFELTKERRDIVDAFMAGDGDEQDAMMDLADEALTWLNDHCDSWVTFGWHEGNLMLMRNEWWSEAD